MVRSRRQRRKSNAVGRHRARSRPGEGNGNPVDEAILHLRHIHSAAIVAVAALRRQNCELDQDIACLLQRSVCDSLDDQLEKLQASRRSPVARLRRV